MDTGYTCDPQRVWNRTKVFDFLCIIPMYNFHLLLATGRIPLFTRQRVT